ncbi:MAG: hypothetical protein HPY83_03380 [Anaerolineae bacterium]|nr:hypothetical protein [Anaerolineae bacterium]
MRRLRVVAVLAALVVVPLLACSPAELLGRSDLGRYVAAMRAPLAEFTTWAQDVLAFYGDVLRLREIDGICSTGRLNDLIARGEGSIGRLRAVPPPSAVSSLHDAVADGGDKTLANLRQVRELLCERRDLARAQEAVEQAQSALRDLSSLLESLRERLPDL